MAASGEPVEIREFPDSTRTAVEAAAAVGASVGQIVKSLLFLRDGQPVLALVSGANQLDPARLAELAGGPMTKADAEAVRRHTGFSIGGVPPVGFPSPIRTFFDRELLSHEVVWAAAGTPHHVFAIAPSELLRLTGANIADLKARAL